MARAPTGTQLAVAPANALAKPPAAVVRPPTASGASTPESRAALRKAAAARKPTAPAQKSSGGSFGWLQGSLCGAAAALSLSTAMLLAILLAPGIAALLIDDRPSKPVARTMLLFGTAASAAPVVGLWQVGHTLTDALAIVMHVQTVLTAWIAAAFGWLLTELMPLVIGFGMSLRQGDERKRLLALRAELAKEWGLAEASAEEAAEDGAG